MRSGLLRLKSDHELPSFLACYPHANYPVKQRFQVLRSVPKLLRFEHPPLPDENRFYNGCVAHAETALRLFGTLPGAVDSDSAEMPPHTRAREKILRVCLKNLSHYRGAVQNLGPTWVQNSTRLARKQDFWRRRPADSTGLWRKCVGVEI